MVELLYDADKYAESGERHGHVEPVARIAQGE
jgi:hypothetical protein